MKIVFIINLIRIIKFPLNYVTFFFNTAFLSLSPRVGGDLSPNFPAVGPLMATFKGKNNNVILNKY